MAGWRVGKERLLVPIIPILLAGCQIDEKSLDRTPLSATFTPTVTSTATATVTVTLRLPTLTLLPTPTWTPEVTVTPRSGRTEFLFDDGVSTAKRETIQKWLEISRRELGDAGDVRVYAYENPPLTEFWLNNPHIAFSSAGAIYLRTAYLERLNESSPTYLASFPHEYFHMLQYHLVGRDFIEPWWFVEGSADYKMYRVLDKYGAVSYSRAREEWKRPAAMAARAENIPARGQEMARQREVFDVGFFKAELLAYLAGEEAITNYWKAARLADWETAFKQTFGLTVAEFEEKFEIWRVHGYEMKYLPR